MSIRVILRNLKVKVRSQICKNCEAVLGQPRPQTFFADNLWLRSAETESHGVRLVNAHRLICNMVYLSHRVTFTWGQILTLTFQCRYVHVSTRLGERNTMPFELCGVLVSTVIGEIRIVKNVTFTFHDLWSYPIGLRSYPMKKKRLRSVSWNFFCSFASCDLL